MKISIVVPTRNRPGPLECTLAGLSIQQHDDYEIVISDNSSPAFAEQNREIIERMLASSQYRYVRSEAELNMVDHWNFAVAQSEGDYVGFVTDRMTLHSSTLAMIDDIFSKENVECVCYLNTTVVRSGDGWGLQDELVGGGYSIESSAATLKLFSQSVLTKRCPRFLNSFCSKEVLNTLRSNYGSVFGGIAPDYGFCFRFLSLFDNFSVIKTPLLVDHSPSFSNGMAIAGNKSNNASVDFLRRLYQFQSDILKIGPLENEFMLLPNVILREYEFCKQNRAGDIEFPDIDAEQFVRSCIPHVKKTVRFSDPISQKSVDALRVFSEKNKLKLPRQLKDSVLFRAKLRNVKKTAQQKLIDLLNKPSHNQSITPNMLTSLLTSKIASCSAQQGPVPHSKS